MTHSPGEWIQARRAYLKLTRVQLAQQVACSPDTIKKIETGKRRPSKQIAQALATSLKIHAQDIEPFVEFARGEIGAVFYPPDDLTQRMSTVSNESAKRTGSLDQSKVLQRLPPLPDQRLFGIEKRLNRLEPMLKDQNRPWMISIEGIGGIGKTTLAHTLVQRVIGSGQYDDIGWVSAKQEEFVTGRGIRPVYNLSLALDEETLIDSLLAQLAEGPYPIDNKFAKRAALHELLQTKTCLIVVDNLETVADYQALLPLLRHLARPSKFLITSRMSLQQELDIGAESVSELSLEDTIDFLKHVAAEQQNQQLLSADDLLLEQIYQTVGGNPLAIKLVLGQANILPLAEVLNSIRLTQSADADQLYLYIYRQAWDILSEAGRKLLLALPIVPNGTFKQLTISSQLPPFEVHAAINELRSLSLIDIGQVENYAEPRYRIHRLTETFLMHEVVKWKDELSPTVSAENRFFQDRVVAMVDHWRSSSALSQSDIAQLDQEKDGMLTAIRLSLSIPSAWDASKALIKALTSYMERRGHWSEWQSVLEEGINSAQSQGDIAGELELMGMRGRILQRQGKEDDVIKNYRDMIRRTKHAGLDIELARACSNLGFTLIERFQWWRAEVLCCHALEIFNMHQHQHGLAHTHNHLGFLYSRSRNFESGLKHLQIACQLWEEIDDPSGLVLGYMNLSALALETQQPRQALDWVDKGIVVTDKLQEYSRQIIFFNNGAYAHTLLNQFKQAVIMAEKAENLAQKFMSLNGMCLAWGNLGFIKTKQKEWDAATAYFEEAASGFRKLNNKNQLIALEEKKTSMFIEVGRKQEAKQALISLSDLCAEMPNELNLGILNDLQKQFNHRFSN